MDVCAAGLKLLEHSRKLPASLSGFTKAPESFRDTEVMVSTIPALFLVLRKIVSTQHKRE